MQIKSKPNFVIWSQPSCQGCMAAKLYISNHGYEYIEKTIGAGVTKEDFMKAVPGARTVPQIFMNNNNISILEKNLKLCIFDECHNISGNEIFEFIEKLDAFCNSKNLTCQLRNANDWYIFDSGHLTIAGAVYLGKEIELRGWLN